MLIELVFKGVISDLNFDFLKFLLKNARAVRFNFPETEFWNDFEEMVSVFTSNLYVDLVIDTDCLVIKDRVIPKVFINVGRNDHEIEILLFLDAMDLKEPTPSMNIDLLKSWMEEFQKTYHFKYFICQMDNADENEYYFNSYGEGKLYDQLK